MTVPFRTSCRRGHPAEAYIRYADGTPNCLACDKEYYVARRPAPRPTGLPRFEALVDRSGGFWACWPWLGKVQDGYGRIRFAGRIWYTHRLAFFLANGYLPEAVCHRCDNPPCCNPAHLREGTFADNTAEMWAKGRSRVAIKLNADHRASIRAAVATSGMRLVPSLAAKHGVSTRTIYRALSA